jgi:D-2-hydroxyacid dehydrogenase (NADP+)
MKILSTCYHDEFPMWTLPDWVVDRLRQKFPGFEIVKLTSGKRIPDEIVYTDVLLAWAIRPEHIAAAKKLKWIHAAMAGLTWILIPEVVHSDIVVSNSKGVHAIPMAEHTMALILQFSRRLIECHDAQRRAHWARREIYESAVSFSEIYEKTICILGVGRIGSEIARRARAFGMRVLGIRKNVDRPVDAVDAVYPPHMLDEILPLVDYLVIAAPATRETSGMIGQPQFSRMKPSAFVINIARGEIVDQQALVDALKEGRIAGAALDVFQPDPLPDDHPLFSTPNLIVTPHISAISPMLWHRITDIFVKNINRFLTGKPLINQVDKQRGY